VIVRVADNGPGIPDEEKDRVLEWNVKGADSPGTGLGLAIANTVAERYGGTLWIEDNDPGGTVMNVELPLTSRTDPDAHRDEIQPS
jgi:signal transduction histidine kinase